MGSHAGHNIRAHGLGHESLGGLWPDISPAEVLGTVSGDRGVAGRAAIGRHVKGQDPDFSARLILPPSCWLLASPEALAGRVSG